MLFGILMTAVQYVCFELRLVFPLVAVMARPEQIIPVVFQVIIPFVGDKMLHHPILKPFQTADVAFVVEDFL